MKILDGEILHGVHVRIDVDRNSNQLALRAHGPRSHGLTTCHRGHMQAPRARPYAVGNTASSGNFVSPAWNHKIPFLNELLASARNATRLRLSA